jgi:hypothetical protein
MPIIKDANFAEGQNDYARGGSLRDLINRLHASVGEEQKNENEAASALFGFLDSAITSIRRIDNQLGMPQPGPARE